MTHRKWHALVHLVADVEAELSRKLTEAHGLGLSEFRALELLASAPDSELRMQELATGLRRDQSSVTRMVARMERQGLAARDHCPDDKRGIYAVITEQGRLRYEVARASYEEALEAALDAREDAQNPGFLSRFLL